MKNQLQLTNNFNRCHAERSRSAKRKPETTNSSPENGRWPQAGGVFFLISTLTLLLLCGTNGAFSQTKVNKEWQSNSGLPATVDWQASATHPAGLTATVGNQQNGTSADLYVALTNRDGTLLWERTLDPYGDNDYGSCVAFSGTDLLVGGATFNPDSNDYNAIIARYDSSGTLLWSEIMDGISGGNDAITALNVSGNGYIFATGGFEGSGTLYDYHTMKLDGNGNILWEATYDYEGLFDVPAAISVDEQNNVVVTGGSSSTFTDWDYATVKYDANGNELGTHRLEATGAGIDRPAAMKRTASGYIHITGTASDDGVDYNLRTIKLSPTLN